MHRYIEMTLEEAEASQWIRISVKYSSVCEVCRSEVLQGEQAFWNRGSKRLKHISCINRNNINHSTLIGQASETNATHSSLLSRMIDSNSNKDTSAAVSIIRCCEHCGFSLAQIELPKFCPGCGEKLIISEPHSGNTNAAITKKEDVANIAATTTAHSFTAPVPQERGENFDKSKNNDDKDSFELEGISENPSKGGAAISIEELGRRLEDMTAQILASMGYSTEKRQILVGKSRSRNEIDIVAKKGDKLLAVECKNYSRYVGADQLREFKSKLDDLQIENALFVTNVVFSKDAELFANHHHIALWDGRTLRENFFSMTIGRLGSSHQQEKEIVLKDALPVNITFEQVSMLHLANPSALKLQRSRLIFHPYYRYDYHLDITRQDPGRGNHRVRDEGSIVVDALDGEILSTQGKASRLFSRFANSSNASEADDAVASREEHQVILDLSNIRAERNYKTPAPKAFEIIKLEYGVLYKSAMYSVISKVIEDNTKEVTYNLRVSKSETHRRKMQIIPKPSEVRVKKISMIYVPLWSLDMEGNGSGVGGISYSKRVLAASGVTLVDTIAHCPKHLTLGKLQFIKRQTYAVCEVCGGAFCEDHISQIEGKFYCQQHAPALGTYQNNSKEVEKKGMLGSLKKGLSGIKL